MPETLGSKPQSRPNERVAPQRSRQSRLLIFAALIGAAGWRAWAYLGHGKSTDGRLVLQGDIDVRQVNLAFKVDGRIEVLNGDEGDSVKAAAVIASLDPRYFEDGGPRRSDAIDCRWLGLGLNARLQIWDDPASVGQPLPTLPLWLDGDLEGTYEKTCRNLRIP